MRFTLSANRFLREVLEMSNEPVVRRTAGTALLVLCLSACSPQSSTAANAAGSEAGMPKIAQVQPAPAAAPATTPHIGVSGRVLPDFAGLVDRFGPAVVNVAVVGKRQNVFLSSCVGYLATKSGLMP